MKSSHPRQVVDRTGALIVAERANLWLDRLERSQDPNDHAEFIAWLKESPLHVREVLSATTFDALLPAILESDHKLNIDELLKRATTNVVPLGSYEKKSPAVPAKDQIPTARSRRSHLAASFAAGIATALIVMFGCLALHKSEFHQDAAIDQVVPQMPSMDDVQPILK